MKQSIKRVIFVLTVTVCVVVGFSYFCSDGKTDGVSALGEEAHGAHDEKEGDPHGHGDEDAEGEEKHHGHGGEEEIADIPLTEKQVSTVDLKMGEVKNREMDATIQATGTLVLRAQSMADVSSLMGGIVKRVLVNEGEHVGKGQVVAMVENTDVVSLQKEYFTAYKEMQMARMEMERQEGLAQNGAGIKKNLQQTRKDYQVAHASMTGLGRQLAQLGISTREVSAGKFTCVFPLRSPISGTVSQITASLGSYADMQTPLMKIRNNNAVECDLNVFEKDINKVKVGDRVLLSLTNQAGVNVGGRVYGMNEYFNDGTKSVAVHVRLDAKRGARLFDGMFVSGRIATGRQVCNALPDKAIVRADGKSYIFVLNNAPRSGKYSFSRHEVTTGLSEDGYTEVELCKHIRKGQKVVTDNAFYLASLTTEHGEHTH